MTESQKLALQLSETRQKLNELLAVKETELTDEQRNELREKTDAYPALEERYRAALIAEETTEGKAADETGEGAEFRGLVEKVELRAYLVEAMTGREADGEAKELREAVFGDYARAGLVPWEALLVDRPGAGEERADATTNAPSDVGATQRPVLGRVFADTAAMFLGVEMPNVGVGEANFPVLSSGATGQFKAKGDAKDAEAATIGAEVLTPKRLTARYVFGVEDAARLGGMEEALRMDLSGALGEALDKQILTGSGVAPSLQGFVDDGGIPAPAGADPTSVATWPEFIRLASSGVDGRYARNLMGVRTLVNPASYQLAASLLDTTGSATASDYLIQRSAGFMASALLPDASNDIADTLIYRAAMGAGSAVAPVFGGLELIRDMYTKAAEGEVAVTAIMLADFAILRAAAYQRGKVKIA